MIRKMMRVGMDIARLNFSHGKSQELLHKIGIIRLLNSKYRRCIKLLGDLQKMIIKKCNRAGKFVITAAQMLESIVENLRPTLAEVTNAANAIIDVPRCR